MKVGILTFHCAHNYGAVLQCYALQETLKNMGHDVEVIDYRPQYLITPYQRFNIRWFLRKNIFKVIKRIFREIYLYRIRKNRYNNFNQFITNHFNLSKEIENNIIPDNYDIYIIGSDQVWNKYITNGIDPIFWGEFRKSSTQEIITYAASMEASEISKEDQSKIKKLLENFNYISVREETLKQLLVKITEKNIEVVLDPTLIANPRIWDQIIIPSQKKRRYILLYQYFKNKNILRIANRIATQINAEVLNITTDFLTKDIDNSVSLYDISPEAFLGYFKDASLIITPTFHGTAFSIIFNRPFYFVKLKDTENTRVNTLLTNLQLSNRIINETDTPVFNDLDYSQANIKLNDLREKSINFLKKAGL